jgi:hypothetical protein
MKYKILCNICLQIYFVFHAFNFCCREKKIKDTHIFLSSFLEFMMKHKSRQEELVAAVAPPHLRVVLQRLGPHPRLDRHEHRPARPAPPPTARRRRRTWARTHEPLPATLMNGDDVVCVRNVISGSPDQETDPIRALIGGACRVWQWAPSRAAPQ